MDNELVSSTQGRSGKTEHPCTYEGCTMVFSKNSKLQYHIRRHTGERPFACDEPNCNKTYLYPFHLRRHKETHSKRTTERITCPHEGCYLELANQYSLKKHIKRKHNLERNYSVTCHICQQGFFKKRQLLEHSYVHTGILPLKCEKCDCRFPGVYERNRHMRTHSLYSCTCGDSFERWSHLLKHKKLCGRIQHVCNVCDRQFNQADNLQRHLKSHFCDDSHTFNCGYDNCSRSYLLKKNLIHHITYCHKKVAKRRIYCGYPNCNQSFTRKQNLTLHIIRAHSGTKKNVIKPRNVRKDKGSSRSDIAAVLSGLDVTRKNVNSHGQNLKKEHPCTFEGCSKVFWKNSTLQYHIMHHTGERPFVCDEPRCNKAFFYSFHLSRHKETHTKKQITEDQIVYPQTPVLPPFRCKKCGTRFPSINELNEHLQTHSYSCFCGDTFTRRSLLLNHKKICNKIGYMCHICDHPFNKEENLKRHLKLHLSDGSEKFYCGYDECSAVYIYKKNLIQHIKYRHRKVAKERSYCGYPNCNESFSRKHTLKLHIKKVHSDTKKIKEANVSKDKGSCDTNVPAGLNGLDITVIEISCQNKPTNMFAVTGTIAEQLAKDSMSDCVKTI